MWPVLVCVLVGLVVYGKCGMGQYLGTEPKIAIQDDPEPPAIPEYVWTKSLFNGWLNRERPEAESKRQETSYCDDLIMSFCTMEDEQILVNKLEEIRQIVTQPFETRYESAMQRLSDDPDKVMTELMGSCKNVPSAQEFADSFGPELIRAKETAQYNSEMNIYSVYSVFYLGAFCLGCDPKPVSNTTSGVPFVKRNVLDDMHSYCKGWLKEFFGYRDWYSNYTKQYECAIPKIPLIPDTEKRPAIDIYEEKFCTNILSLIQIFDNPLYYAQKSFFDWNECSIKLTEFPETQDDSTFAVVNDKLGVDVLKIAKKTNEYKQLIQTPQKTVAILRYVFPPKPALWGYILIVTMVVVVIILIYIGMFIFVHRRLAHWKKYQVI